MTERGLTLSDVAAAAARSGFGCSESDPFALDKQTDELRFACTALSLWLGAVADSPATDGLKVLNSDVRAGRLRASDAVAHASSETPRSSLQDSIGVIACWPACWSVCWAGSNKQDARVQPAKPPLQ